MSNKSDGSPRLGLNKLSFWLIIIVAVLYLVAMILGLLKLNSTLISALQNIASAILICIVGGLGWKYVKGKPLSWKLLYILALLVVLAGIVVPLIF